MGLTVTRRCGQLVRIGPGITVKVRRVLDNKDVELTINAPRDVYIARDDYTGPNIPDDRKHPA